MFIYLVHCVLVFLSFDLDPFIKLENFRSCPLGVVRAIKSWRPISLLPAYRLPGPAGYLLFLSWVTVNTSYVTQSQLLLLLRYSVEVQNLSFSFPHILHVYIYIHFIIIYSYFLSYSDLAGKRMGNEILTVKPMFCAVYLLLLLLL